MAGLCTQTSTQPMRISRALRRAARSCAEVFGRRPAWSLSSAA
jgi:hypothetical protein